MATVATGIAVVRGTDAGDCLLVAFLMQLHPLMIRKILTIIMIAATASKQMPIAICVDLLIPKHECAESL